MKLEVVKVQVPLWSSTDLTPDCLVYAEGRSRVSSQPVPDHVRTALGRARKGYFIGTWDGGEWQLGARVTDRTW